MQLIKIGHFEINPEQILFLDHQPDFGYYIIFNGKEVIEVLNDSNEYLDLSMFITTARHYYGNGNANETQESPESSQASEKSTNDL